MAVTNRGRGGEPLHEILFRYFYAPIGVLNGVEKIPSHTVCYFEQQILGVSHGGHQ